MPIEDLAGNDAADFTNQPARNEAPPEQWCFALGAGALEVNPVWTKVDRYVGVRVQRVHIRRGRSSERETMPVGEMTISGIDTAGVLDPTNPDSPFWGISDTQLNPVMQTTYALRNPVTGNYKTLFRGYLDDIDYDIDLSGKFATFECRCVDALDILSDAEVIPGRVGDSGSATGDVVYLAAAVDDRIKAALADAALSVGVTEWPTDLMEIFTGNVDVQKCTYSPRTKILQVIEEAVQAEWPGAAALWVSKDGVVTFHGRLARFNPTEPSYKIHHWKVGDWPAVLADSGNALISGLKLSRGKDDIINASLSTPQGIADADIAGQFVYDAASIARFGAQSSSNENLITLQHTGGSASANDETKLFSQYEVDTHKDPHTRVKSVTFRPQSPDSLQGPETWNLICNADISDLFTVKTTHSWGGGVNDDYFGDGFEYDIVPGNKNFAEVTLRIDLSPRELFPDGYFSP